MAVDPERTGVLLLRAWLDGSPPQLKVRITQTPDIEGEDPQEATAATADDVLAAVRAWLDSLSREL